MYPPKCNETTAKFRARCALIFIFNSLSRRALHSALIKPNGNALTWVKPSELCFYHIWYVIRLYIFFFFFLNWNLFVFGHFRMDGVLLREKNPPYWKIDVEIVQLHNIDMLLHQSSFFQPILALLSLFINKNIQASISHVQEIWCDCYRSRLTYGLTHCDKLNHILRLFSLIISHKLHVDYIFDDMMGGIHGCRLFAFHYVENRL